MSEWADQKLGTLGWDRHVELGSGGLLGTDECKRRVYLSPGADEKKGTVGKG